MAFEVKKQNRETSQGLVRRFGQQLQRSGVLFRARKLRFRHRPKSDGAKKTEALRRGELKKEYRQLEKMGKLPPRKQRRR